MLANVTFYNDQELPTTDLIWTQPDGTSLYDFSSGWTFSLRLARVTAPATTLLLKTTGITGAATSPNLSIAWSTSDWSGLEASTNGTKYVGAVYARRTADSYDMAANISVTLKAAPGTSAVSPSSYPVTVTAASVTLADAGGFYASTESESAFAEAVGKFAPMPGATGSGKWVAAAGIGGGAAAAVDGKLCLVPFRAVPGRTLDRIGITISTLGASSTVRLGIYPDDGFGYPHLTASPTDFGTVDSSTTGQKTITISYAITKPLIWLAAASQGGTPPSWNTVATGVSWQWGDTATSSFTDFNGGYQKTGVTGALGVLSAVTAQSPSGSPMLYVRYV